MIFLAEKQTFLGPVGFFWLSRMGAGMIFPTGPPEMDHDNLIVGLSPIYGVSVDIMILGIVVQVIMVVYIGDILQTGIGS